MTMDLHVIQTIGTLSERSGGPARTVRDLAQAIARIERPGTRVSIIAGHDPESDGPLIRVDPALVTTHLVPVQRRLGLPTYAMHGMLASIAKNGTAIVHDNGIWSPAHIAVAAAARRLALPLVLSPHGMLEPWALAWHGRRKKLALVVYQRRIFEGANGLVATAPSECSAIRSLLPFSPIATIANGVACPAVAPDRSPRDQQIERTLLFMSRLHPKKNLPGLIDSFALLAGATEFANWRLIIAGSDEGGHRAELAAQIARLGLAERITMPGPIAEADKSATFAAADLFILPTFSENFGIVVAEALAAGVPVIATTGAPWEALVTQRCGWHVAPDRDSLAKAMAAAMRMSATQRREMGQRGHAYVRDAFGWNSIARQMLGFYDWLLGKGPPQPFMDCPAP